MDQANVYSHSRSRTTSSNVLGHHPPGGYYQQPQQQLQQQQQQQYYLHQQQLQQQQQQQQQGSAPPNQQSWRRSPSINTFSTNSSFQPPAAYRISSNTDLRRSTSSRSIATTTQAPSYVALLRKQKATVWCDHSQYEDPRAAAQQRAAKMRANLEVSGGGRTKTGLTSGKVTAKIRHGKTPAVVGYAPGETHVGVGGVPVRLSANEVDEKSDDDEDGPSTAKTGNHHRAGSSGRSSLASGRRGPQYRSSGGGGSGLQTQRTSASGTPERSTSLVDHRNHTTSATPAATDDAASGRAQSSGSGSSGGERQDNLGELGNVNQQKLASNSKMHSAITREKSVKTAEELRRRGSVDERTTTLTSGRLFIANPD